MQPERSIILRSKADLERAIIFLQSLVLDNDHPWEIVVKLYKFKRTLAQNKRYHAVCAEISEQLILNGREFGPDTLKEYFKRLFIGSNEVPMPDGTTAIYGISTTTLKTGEFAVYMTKIDAWATQNGVIFEVNRALLDDYQAQADEWRARHRNDPELRERKTNEAGSSTAVSELRG